VTLTIDKLCVRGKIPRRSNVDRTLIDRAREEFVVECRRQLRPSWPVQPRVARIRRLRVRVNIPATQLRPDTLAKAWTAAFLRELFAALTDLNGNEILQFESRAEYLAAAIKVLLDGATAQRWAYEEFEDLFDVGTPEAVLTLFEREHSEPIPILLILEDRGLLDRLLAIWNGASLERFFSLIASQTGDKSLSIEDLIIVAQLLFDDGSSEMGPTGDPNPVEGKVALRFFLDCARKSNWRTTQSISPQIISQVLRIIHALLDLFKSKGIRWRSLADGAGHAGDSILSGPAIDICNMIVAAGGENRTASAELLDRLRLIAGPRIQENLLIEFTNIIAAGNIERRTTFAELLEQLALATGAGTSPEARWKSTDCAGLFLLIGVLEELGWEDRLTGSSLEAGPRLLAYVLAGVASAVLNRFTEEPAYLDAGMALFSGWIDQPNLDGLRGFLASGSGSQPATKLILFFSCEYAGM